MSERVPVVFCIFNSPSPVNVNLLSWLRNGHKEYSGVRTWKFWNIIKITSKNIQDVNL